MIGDIYIDGEHSNPVMMKTGKQMCEVIIAAGLFDGTWDELWNLSPSGELWHVGTLYLDALRLEGHRIELETEVGLIALE